jgi:hypothetical protein
MPPRRETCMRTPDLISLALLSVASLAPTAQAGPVITYRGPCDASAAVALDSRHFIVGDDEHDTLHIYRDGRPEPVATVPLASFLGTGPGAEADIEGAAAIGTRIYWITSHSRNSKGRLQPSRYRFFATDISAGDPPTVKPAGRPYTQLLRDLASAAALEPYRLGMAAGRVAEAEGGLNIEGLAATPEGGLLIGLRNPLPGSKALVVPLLDPGELIEGKPARFGAPAELDLGRRGIRSIERIADSYLIVGGPVADEGSFALFRWSGIAGEPARPVTGTELGKLRPEALFAYPGSDEIQLLSDDGGIRVDGVECKKLPAARQSFRSLSLKPGN